jgi:hypothetical protein
MKLERLACRQAQRTGGIGARELIELQPLACAADATGQAYASHEKIRRLQPLAPALIANIAIVLLIKAEKLHQLGVIRRHCGGDLVGEALLDRAAQVIASRFQRLVGPKLLERLGNVAAAVSWWKGRHRAPQ